MIDVLDYKAGNAPSVINALQEIAVPCRLVRTADEIRASRALVLPGVGSAAATLESLRESGCLPALEQRVMGDEIPFLGICIGMQIIFAHSEEGDTPCLGWLDGTVKRFPQARVRVPQMGWNRVQPVREHPLTRGIGRDAHFYFVNSYYPVPAADGWVLATTDYGIPFCSIVARDHIMATQFHAEKSGVLGLRLLANFAAICEVKR